jgi:hypothetical protein
MLGDYETLCNAMAERPLVILRRSNKTPVLAMCENCSLKFFTPRELARPVEAEKYLQQKFNSHEKSNTKLWADSEATLATAFRISIWSDSARRFARHTQVSRCISYDGYWRYGLNSEL